MKTTKEVLEEFDNLANIYDLHDKDCMGHLHSRLCPVLKLRAFITQSHQDLKKEIKEEVEKMKRKSYKEGDFLEHRDKDNKVYNSALQDILKLLDK